MKSSNFALFIEIAEVDVLDALVCGPSDGCTWRIVDHPCQRATEEASNSVGAQNVPAHFDHARISHSKVSLCLQPRLDHVEWCRKSGTKCSGRPAGEQVLPHLMAVVCSVVLIIIIVKVVVAMLVMIIVVVVVVVEECVFHCLVGDEVDQRVGYVHEQSSGVGGVQRSEALALQDGAQAIHDAPVGTLVHLHALLDHIERRPDRIVHGCCHHTSDTRSEGRWGRSRGS